MSARGLRPTDALALLRSGKVTVRVGGVPLLSLRPEERELDVDVAGAKDAGLDLSRIVEVEAETPGLVRGVAHLGRHLSDLGWTLNLSDEGERLLSLGRGVPRVTGHVRLSPLHLRKLLDATR